MTTHRSHLISAGSLAVVLALQGCALAAAGVLEATKTAHSDPLGVHEYQGTDGSLGWYDSYAEPRQELRRVRLGFRELGCRVADESENASVARCADMPELRVERDGDKLFRLCVPGTERMQCRSAWEKVQWESPGVMPPEEQGVAGI